MLRHCHIPRFSSGGRRKMPNVSFGKEKTSSDVEKQPLAGAEAKDVATEPLPPQKILKIFSINIIAQGLPFCRRRGFLSDQSEPQCGAAFCDKG
ncbi:hypothetical protein KUCAC02_015891, partial [Chaenocephalus aceratus]